MKKTLNLSVPGSWSELSDGQLRFVYRLLAQQYTSAEIRTKCLLRWSDTHVQAGNGKEYYLLRHHGETFDVSALQIAQIISHLRWLDELPASPVRIARFRLHRALPADFMGVPFELFLVCDNLYQGYLATKNDALLDEMGKVMYRCRNSRLPAEYRIGIFYWFAALKQYFARSFPHFYQPTKSDDANLLGAQSATNQVAEAMNAQIRALTKGDITKEKTILSLDTWRALTELDAQAKEYAELQSKYPTK
ncbi:MAG: hypothetical protein Q4B68_10625 [Bacteroidales bacterium]|nr:hypothetical protein [Bacteroidales bacterium]